MSIELRMAEYCRRYPIDSFGILKGNLVEIASVGYKVVKGRRGTAYSIAVFYNDAPDSRFVQGSASFQPTLPSWFRDSQSHNTSVQYRRMRVIPKALV
jgi:hypothetical protein